MWLSLLLAKLPILVKRYNTYNLVFLDEFGRKRTQQIIFLILMPYYCRSTVFSLYLLLTFYWHENKRTLCKNNCFISTPYHSTWALCFNKTDNPSMQYQPLVATVPIIGTHATNMWYAQYQRLVLCPLTDIYTSSG